ncbi:MAG TPA: type II toxin-antitoxin system HicA family toxin [Anaerolineae bacterium]|nr:type II toxin-antitoxin system HicA family toxin [Anaerolineae bacterium]HQI83527.1 type II toxin-antitoxin system HicA family toxin [Anaerolineae bacterium]
MSPLKLKSSQRRTLQAVFDNPVRANILWRDVESLLLACGAEISEGRGSRVRVVLNGVKAIFHRPHPHKEINKGAVVSIRRFLTEAGVTPDDGI